MKRLTQKDEQGNWCLKGVSWEQLHEGQVNHQAFTGTAVWSSLEVDGV